MSDCKYKVLVVEDELFIRRHIVNEIEDVDMGFKVEWTAYNGEDALEIIEKENPDVVFTDIKMPIMSGMELIERIRERDSHLPIVLLSGFAEFDYARQAITLKVEDYLLKPLETEELKSVLRKIRYKLKMKEKTKKKELLFSKVHRIEGSQSLPFQHENEEIYMYLIQIGSTYHFEPSKGIRADIQDYWENPQLEQCIERLCKENIYWMIDERKPNRKFLLVKHAKTEQEEEHVKFAETLLTELRGYLNEIPVYIAASDKGICYPEIGVYSEKLRMLMENTNNESRVLVCKKEYEDSKSDGERLVREVKYYINQHYKENLTISYLCEKFHFSRNHLTKVFKSSTGESPGNYLLQVRMEKAIEFMKNQEELEIQTIAKMVGYDDSHYFSRIFKNKMGISPSEFRSSLNEED